MANPHVVKANKYARDVVSGKIPSCKLVYLACKKHLDELAEQKKKSFAFKFSEAEAERVCEFIELLPHTKGKWASKRETITLEPWQCFLFCCLFGWLRKKCGMRRFRKAYIKVPRKNGKSIVAAGAGLFMFAADGEFGAEVYSGATTEKQAWEVFRPAKQMMERTPELSEALAAEVWAKALLVPSDGSKFEPVVGKPGDGASPSCAIVDEYHEHDTSDLVDTMESGMGAREQPLVLIITTAGYNIAGPCYEQEQESIKALTGVDGFQNDELFSLMYGIDEGDDPWSIEALYKANPNIGVSVFLDFLIAQQQQARQSAAKQVRFLTKHLNKWCSAKAAWMNLDLWNACADYTLRPEQFEGCDAWVALDLASTSDICVVMLLFRKIIDGKAHYYLFGRYFLPENEVENNPKNHNAYKKWVIEGFLEQHEGAEIEYDLVRECVEELIEKFHPREIAFDPWRAAHMAQQLMKDGAEMIEFRQLVQTMSLPMKEFESAVKAGRLHHDGNPVLTWMVSNVVAKLDKKDNIYPNKEKNENKIDGVVAGIMAIARAMADEEVDDWAGFLANPIRG